LIDCIFIPPPFVSPPNPPPHRDDVTGLNTGRRNLSPVLPEVRRGAFIAPSRSCPEYPFMRCPLFLYSLVKGLFPKLQVPIFPAVFLDYTRLILYLRQGCLFLFAVRRPDIQVMSFRSPPVGLRVRIDFHQAFIFPSKRVLTRGLQRLGATVFVLTTL